MCCSFLHHALQFLYQGPPVVRRVGEGLQPCLFKLVSGLKPAECFQDFALLFAEDVADFHSCCTLELLFSWPARSQTPAQAVPTELEKMTQKEEATRRADG